MLTLREWLALVFAVFVLCWVEEGKAADADPIKPTADRASVTVVVKWLPQATVRRRCAELGAWGGMQPHSSEPVGCTAYDRETNICTAYVTAPETIDDAKTLTFGHEVLHCFKGEYHDH